MLRAAPLTLPLHLVAFVCRVFFSINGGFLRYKESSEFQGGGNRTGNQQLFTPLARRCVRLVYQKSIYLSIPMKRMK